MFGVDGLGGIINLFVLTMHAVLVHVQSLGSKMHT
jgi:hypothetical protein